MAQTLPIFDGLRAVLAADVAEVGAHLFVGCFGTGGSRRGRGNGRVVYANDLIQPLADLGGFGPQVGLRGSAEVREQTQIVGRECIALWKFALFVDSDTDGRIALLRHGTAALEASAPFDAALAALVAVRP